MYGTVAAIHGAGDAVRSKAILDVMAEGNRLEDVSSAQGKGSSVFAVLLPQYTNVK